MRVLVVDDEKLSLEGLREKLTHIERVTEVHPYTSPEEALVYFEKNGADVAFLDVTMSRMDGLTLATRLRELQPSVAVIFVTGYTEYALNALQLHADGYLLKPVDEEELTRELDSLARRNPPKEKELRIRAQCFGNFELFVDGAPVKFRRSKTKELLAYLIDRRGAAVNAAELCAVIWEEPSRSEATYLRHLISDLRKSLAAVHASELLVSGRNSYAVNVREVDCDAYRFRERDMEAVNAYQGEYMSQYSWAELTLGELEQSKK